MSPDDYSSTRISPDDVLIIPAMNEHPVTLHVMDDLRRSRLTVFFRFLLTIPHLIWLELWAIVVMVVFIPNWLVALIIGGVGEQLVLAVPALHRRLSALCSNSRRLSPLYRQPVPGLHGRARQLSSRARATNHARETEPF